MGREILKKTMEPTPPFLNPFDEDATGQGDTFDFALPPGMESSRDESIPPEIGISSEGMLSRTGFDDPDFFEGSLQEPQPREEGTAPPDPQASALGAVRRKKMVFLGTALTVLMMVALLGWLWTRSTPGTHPQPRPPAVITRPILVPHHLQESTFLVLLDKEPRKELLEMTLELDFNSDTTYEYFTRHKILLQNAIYDFLQAQKPAESTSKVWQTIIKEDLFKYLKTQYPEARMGTIRVRRFSRL